MSPPKTAKPAMVANSKAAQKTPKHTNATIISLSKRPRALMPRDEFLKKWRNESPLGLPAWLMPCIHLAINGVRPRPIIPRAATGVVSKRKGILRPSLPRWRSDFMLMIGPSSKDTTAGNELIKIAKTKFGIFRLFKYQLASPTTERSRMDHAKSPQSSHRKRTTIPPVV